MSVKGGTWFGRVIPGWPCANLLVVLYENTGNQERIYQPGFKKLKGERRNRRIAEPRKNI